MKYGLKTKPLQRHLNVIRPPTKQHMERNQTFKDSMNGVAIAGYETNYQLSWVDKSIRVSGWVSMTN